MQNCNSCHKRA